MTVNKVVTVNDQYEWLLYKALLWIENAVRYLPPFVHLIISCGNVIFFLLYLEHRLLCHGRRRIHDGRQLIQMQATDFDSFKKIIHCDPHSKI